MSTLHYMDIIDIIDITGITFTSQYKYNICLLICKHWIYAWKRYYGCHSDFEI